MLTIIKYERYKRNKAILSLLWDLNAHPHEVTLLRIKHIRLKERYGEGKIPHEAKTGTGPILLTISFPYGNYLYLKKAVAGEDQQNESVKY